MICSSGYSSIISMNPLVFSLISSKEETVSILLPAALQTRRQNVVKSSCWFAVKIDTPFKGLEVLRDFFDRVTLNSMKCSSISDQPDGKMYSSECNSTFCLQHSMIQSWETGCTQFFVHLFIPFNSTHSIPLRKKLTVILVAKHCTYFAVVHGYWAISLQLLYLAVGICSKKRYTVPPPDSICDRKWSLKNGVVPNRWPFYKKNSIRRDKRDALKRKIAYVRQTIWFHWNGASENEVTSFEQIVFLRHWSQNVIKILLGIIVQKFGNQIPF